MAVQTLRSISSLGLRGLSWKSKRSGSTEHISEGVVNGKTRRPVFGYDKGMEWTWQMASLKVFVGLMRGDQVTGGVMIDHFFL